MDSKQISKHLTIIGMISTDMEVDGMSKIKMLIKIN